MNTLWATLSCHIWHMPSESSSNLTRLQGPREGLLGKAARATPSGNALFISSRAKERPLSKTADLEHQSLKAQKARIRRWQVWE